ncbi:MAG: SUMF1/EgtB/PvdO family nonheme iron enzyme [Pseudomonadales bacterium]
MTDQTRQRLIIAAILVLVWVVIDWFTLDVGLVKPVVLGAGSLEVQSNADGAEVLLDGIPKGTTPVTLPELLAGTYTLLVRHRFHPPHVSEVQIERGSDQRLEIRVVPAFGTLMLATNPEGAAITVDGERLADVTPTTLEQIVAGEHEVKFEMFGRATKIETIALLPNQRREFVAELNRVDMSEVTVRPDPANARVRFIQVPVEYTPAVRVPVGDYQIEVAARGYATSSQTHRLRKGVNVIDVTLERNRGTLTVNVTPADAKVTVRIADTANIVDYERDMRIPTGRVEVRVRKAGYRTVLRPVNLDTGGRRVNVRLERFDVAPGQTLQDDLDAGGKGPWVIIVPTGGAQIGEPDGDGMTALAQHTVEFDQPFAMGVTEITLGDFRRFTGSMGVDLPDVKGMATDNHPVANVSWHEAVAYTEWLTRQTGNIYRLPTEREWAYVARRGAAVGGVCELGNTADRSLQKVFRQWEVSDCDDGYVRSAPVGSYRANELGLHDMLGNVKEWVSDCGVGGCSSRIARGSAWNSAADDLRLTYRESYDRPADTRGFRVLREL